MRVDPDPQDCYLFWNRNENSELRYTMPPMVLNQHRNSRVLTRTLLVAPLPTAWLLDPRSAYAAEFLLISNRTCCLDMEILWTRRTGLKALYKLLERCCDKRN
jgi:hypothetical protein